MEFLFEDGLCLNRLELGLKVPVDMGAGVATTTWVRHVERRVVDFVTWEAPVVVGQSVMCWLR